VAQARLQDRLSSSVLMESSLLASVGSAETFPLNLRARCLAILILLSATIISSIQTRELSLATKLEPIAPAPPKRATFMDKVASLNPRQHLSSSTIYVNIKAESFIFGHFRLENTSFRSEARARVKRPFVQADLNTSMASTTLKFDLNTLAFIRTATCSSIPKIRITAPSPRIC